jgi:hypothetical protein
VSNVAGLADENPGFHRYNMIEFLGRFIDAAEAIPLFEVTADLPTVTKDGPWIAGGAIRRTLLNEPLASDVDFFFRDEAQAEGFAKDMEARAGWIVSEREQVTTWGVKVNEGKDTAIVQAITLAYYPNLEAVLDSFDFTITQFGWDGTTLVCGQFSLWDLARKRLALHKLTFGVSTVRRLIKYTRQGFTACGGVLASILEEVVARPDTIHREMTYVD